MAGGESSTNRAIDIRAKFIEACGTSNGLAIGDAITEAVWQLEDVSRAGSALGQKRSTASRVREVLVSTKEWGLPETVDRLLDRADSDRRWSSLVGSRMARRCLLVCRSTYENTARAVLRYRSELPDETLLAAARWRAYATWKTNLPRYNYWAFARGKHTEVARLGRGIARALRSGLGAISRDIADGGRMRHAELLRQCDAISASLAASLVAYDALRDRVGMRSVCVGNEFDFGDRLFVMASKRDGLGSVALAHGIFDYHYREVPVLADALVVWGGASARFVLESGCTAPEKVLVVRPEFEKGSVQPTRTPNRVVVFTQPVRFSPVAHVGYENGVRELCVRLHRAGVAVALKPHPLEGGDAWRGTDAEILPRNMPVAAALSECVAAVTLDSTCVIDAVRAGVPVIGMGWCASLYGDRFASEGWLQRSSTPSDAVEGILAIMAGSVATGGRSDPFEGERAGDRERLRRLLRAG